jgi:hypothetical protein
MMPPARWTSSMCTSLLAGATLHSTGTLRDSRSMSSMVKSTSPSWARRAGAAPCWSSRPWRCPASSRSRTRRRRRSSAAARWRRRLRNTLCQIRRSGARPRGTAASRPRGWPASSRCRAAPGPGLGQAVHRVGGEHARAGAAGRAGERSMSATSASLTCHRRRRPWRRPGRAPSCRRSDLAGLHRPAGDEDHRNVEAHRGHQHAGRDLVAVGNADHGVGAVGVDHVLDGRR